MMKRIYLAGQVTGRHYRKVYQDFADAKQFLLDQGFDEGTRNQLDRCYDNLHPLPGNLQLYGIIARVRTKQRSYVRILLCAGYGKRRNYAGHYPYQYRKSKEPNIPVRNRILKCSYMKLCKTIPPDVDIDYHGKVDWKSVRRVLLFLLISWIIIIGLLCSCSASANTTAPKGKWYIKLGDNRTDPWASNIKTK